MSVNNICLFVITTIAILLGVFFTSVSLIDKELIKFPPNIEYDSITITKLPYPQATLTNVKVGNLNIDKAYIYFPLQDILTFSYQKNNIKLQDSTIKLENNFLNMQDFHIMAENLWFYRNDISSIEAPEIEVINNNKKSKILSISLKCNKSKCSIEAPGFNILIAEDKGDILSISYNYSLFDSMIRIEEKFDTKTGNFLGGFKLDSRSGKIKIRGEIAGSKDVTHFRNISADSEQIKGVIDYALFGRKASSIKANMDYLNISGEEIKNIIYALKDYHNNLIIDVNIAYSNMCDTKFSNIKFIANSDKDNLNIANLVGNIESDYNFQFKGKIDDNIEGRLSFSYPDINKLLNKLGLSNLCSSTNKVQKFDFDSIIYIGDKNYNFSNIISKIEEKLDIKGNLGIRFISGAPRVISSLELSNFDLLDKNYPILGNIISYISTISSNMKEKDYLSKFEDIKNLGYKIHTDLYFNNTYIGNHKIDKIHADLRIKDAYVELKKLNIKGENLDLGGEVELQAWGIKPILFANITGSQIKNLSYNYKDIISYFSNNIDFKKLQFHFSLALDKLIASEDLEIQNIRTSVNSDDIGGLKFSNCIFDIFGGRVTSNSYFTLSNLNLDMVFGYNNFLLGPLIKYISKEEPLVTGVASANGRFQTNLINFERFIKEMDMSGNYIGKFINIKNFGIDEYIEQITKKNYEAKARLEYDTYYAPLKGETDISLLSGALSIKDGYLTLKDTNFTTKFTNASIVGDIKLDTLTAGENLKVGFEFILPSQSSNNSSNLEQNKASFSMKIQDYILSPIRTINIEDINTFIKK